MRHAVVALALVLLVGCGPSTVVTAAGGVASPYDGPMSLPIDDPDAPAVFDRSGAAGQAVECEGKPLNGGGRASGAGLTVAQAKPEDALESWLRDEPLQLPSTGYRVEREEGGRVLFSYDVGERTKVAVIAADSARDQDGKTGWGVESWAQCDPAEFPAHVSEALGIGVWQDRSGARVPVTKVQSFQGAEHCDWQDISFVVVGPGFAEQYVRDTKGTFTDSLRTTYDAPVALPDTAVDSGFHRDGRQLWVGRERAAAYLVSLTDARDVERWPAAKEFIGCM